MSSSFLDEGYGDEDYPGSGYGYGPTSLRPLRREDIARLRATGRSLGTPPFGWKMDLCEAGKHVECPREQAILSRMATLRKGGLTYQAIAECMTRDGVFTRRGAKWTKNAVNIVIRRERGDIR
jgi:hypothetical protein